MGDTKMSSMAIRSINTFQNRILLLLFFVLSVVVIVTLAVVKSATYEHSNIQLISHAHTITGVFREKLSNQVTFLDNVLGDISKNYSIKKLIATADIDSDSLNVAMQNYRNRLDTDIYITLDENKRLIVSSLIIPETFSFGNVTQSGISWEKINNKFYLIKWVPVHFVQDSGRVNGWIAMGFHAHRLLENLDNIKSNVQISLLKFGEVNSVIESTFKQNELGSHLLHPPIKEGVLNKFDTKFKKYVYSVLRVNKKSDLYVLVATPEELAYLSYENLLLELIGVLLISALSALLVAMVLSRTITSPLNFLVKVANKISSGQTANEFPKCSTREVNELSAAINEMQLGIKQREQKINDLAYFDDLTYLPNRNQFNIQLSNSLNNCKDDNVVIAILNVDRFKEINDTVGHETGDVLLRNIAERFKSCTTNTTMQARLGGDEFGLIFEKIKASQTNLIATSIAELFEQPFSIGGLVLDVDVSIGVAVYPDDATTQQGLIQCADIALHSVKGHHQACATYKPELNKYSVQRLNLMSELKEAIADCQLKLYYQPKLSIESNEVDSVECLVRWIHPIHGFVPPDEFIGLAEQTGAIRYVTHWVLRTALEQQKKWAAQGDSISIAVNISAVDLVDMELPSSVGHLLSEFGANPNMLTLEVTESALMGDTESATRALYKLRAMGIAISIDDFGTGFSSMAQLKKMPVNELKIDKAFVLELASNDDDKIIVNTLVSLAQNLGLKTVAEGVEDKASLNYLTKIGCTNAQGFYLSKPMPIEEFDGWFVSFAGRQGLNDQIARLA
jgi:diguanylate cyclase (GGDEF)-like protein